MKNEEDLKKILAENSVPEFRAKQYINQVCKNFKFNIEDISIIPDHEKVVLLDLAKPLSIKLAHQQTSSKGDTTKFLFELDGGQMIETVLMKFEDGRNSVCVSSQVGCQMGCKFCATGKLGFKKNLTYEEIFDQVMYVQNELNKTDQNISNVVFMGMGEPFMNYQQVIKACNQLNHKDFLNLGARRITVSTSGITEGISKLAKEKLQLNLAISLHAPDQELREKIMPIAKRWTIKDLMNEINIYIKKTKRRVTYEYIMLSGINDTKKHAEMLAELIKNQLCHVNLIPYNSIDESEFKAPSKSEVIKFKNYLQNYGINATVRIAMGDDIAAACGQLANKKLNQLTKQNG
ncbi:23S rRNA (adenine(2503)-C(2))-methyltransferase RlmN [Candidatus Peregrinibacteria bacterium]|nr:23S rRNA (adenine(2503)-C(2))-methyltransferase RlmN [Candidatus Peregrinibacteria bacterium]